MFGNGATSSALSSIGAEGMRIGEKSQKSNAPEQSSSGNGEADEFFTEENMAAYEKAMANGEYDLVAGCTGQMCRANNYGGNSGSSAIEQFMLDHGYGSLSVRGGFIVVGALDVIMTQEGVSVYVGAGLGAGLSATATTGISAGPSSSGANIKMSASGGFGVGATATGRVSPNGVTPSVGVGTGFGLSVSTTIGYKAKVKDF